MDFVRKKCSLDEHKEIDSKTVCIECNIYMCNKCESFHNKLFPTHKIFNSEKDINEIFTGFCKERGHSKELEFFCKTHNQLCCGICIAKIKKEQIGMHKDCSICTIEEIIEEKKNNREENINYLKELANTLESSINELKGVFEKINENKEEIKSKIQNIFTKIRNELNNREDELLSEVDKKFDMLYCDENIVKESKKLPEKIKTLLEKAENNKEEEKNNLGSFINICINIEKNISNIKEINESINKCKNYTKEKIKFIPEEKDIIDKFLENIKKFGELKKEDYFKEIENPWTDERFKYKNLFYYTLKENNYLAEKTQNNDYIHSIKTSYQFKKDKIYKLEFEVNYKGGDFDIGFGDFSKTTTYAKLASSTNFVAITKDALIINGNNINNNIKIENGKRYEFIIDMKKKNFILNINNTEVGEFSFDFQDNIFAQASIRNVGNSLKIKTYEK